MAVITRLDARSKQNSTLQIVDSSGAVVASIEAVPSSHSASADKLANEVNLRIETFEGVAVVKGNGKILRKG